jgi:hypothetical protein
VISFSFRTQLLLPNSGFKARLPLPKSAENQMRLNMDKHLDVLRIDRERRDLIKALAAGSAALLSPEVLARTLFGQEAADETEKGALNQESLALWSDRLTPEASLAMKSAKFQPQETMFFYYSKDKGFLMVERDVDGQTTLGQMLPATSTNMKLALNYVRPNRDHLDYIKRNKNGTLGVSILPFAEGNSNASAGPAGASSPSDHLISSVSPPPFSYEVPFPSSPSIAADGAPMQAGRGSWAWTFSVQEQAPKWQTFMTELEAAISGPSSTTAAPASKAPTGTKPPATSTSSLAQAIKFMEGGVGAWENLSILGVGLKVFNGLIGKTMAQTGKPTVLLTLPNYQIITSVAGRKNAVGNALPLLEGEYVAIPENQAQFLLKAGKAYELYEGVIVPAGSKDTQSALEETLVPAKGQADPGLTYVSYSVKFS